MTTHARVTNSNDFPIEDRYDGVPVVFEPNVAKVITLEAAALFFGMPVDDEGNVTFGVDHGHLARRWGWNYVEREEKETLDHANKRLLRETADKCSKIKVEPVSYTLREVVQGEEELPAPRDPAPAASGDEGTGESAAESAAPSRRRDKMTVG